MNQTKKKWTGRLEIASLIFCVGALIAMLIPGALRLTVHISGIDGKETALSYLDSAAAYHTFSASVLCLLLTAAGIVAQLRNLISGKGSRYTILALGGLCLGFQLAVAVGAAAFSTGLRVSPIPLILTGCQTAAAVVVRRMEPPKKEPVAGKTPGQIWARILEIAGLIFCAGAVVLMLLPGGFTVSNRFGPGPEDYSVYQVGYLSYESMLGTVFLGPAALVAEAWSLVWGCVCVVSKRDSRKSTLICGLTALGAIGLIILFSRGMFSLVADFSYLPAVAVGCQTAAVAVARWLAPPEKK